MIESEAEELLRGAALRVTRPRVTVLTVIHEHPHSDAATIIGLVRERIGSCSTQAVYDVLKTLVDADLARRIDLPNSSARYEGLRWDDHQHAVCRRCGSLTDVHVAPNAIPLAEPQAPGFVIDAVEITYWGTCPACLSGGAAGPADPAPPRPEMSHHH
ncbi:transcriptional repressor [Occultella glacieicola]|uniref:Transcriptional repressor n=1 Tax=Occultella glacieicola TaxID=2518684 RepID=A0ABY2EAF0_9MICO|nr:Fur family transcriptional regulator [Occultella glacieicola]TDE98920.1 transcriptional repressor [Occultella glacieicola]